MVTICIHCSGHGWGQRQGYCTVLCYCKEKAGLVVFGSMFVSLCPRAYLHARLGECVRCVGGVTRRACCHL